MNGLLGILLVIVMPLIGAAVSIHYDNKKYDELKTMALDEFYRGYAEGKRDAH